MPFEFVVLEACLSWALRGVEAEVRALEAGAAPTVEALSLKVNRTTLEHVRGVKQDMTRLVTRVGRFVEELSDLLEDDEDMADLYLSRRSACHLDCCHLQHRSAGGAPPAGPPDGQPHKPLDTGSWADSAGSLASLESEPPDPAADTGAGEGSCCSRVWCSWRSLQGQFQSLGFRLMSLAPATPGDGSQDDTAFRPGRAHFCIQGVYYDAGQGDSTVPATRAHERGGRQRKRGQQQQQGYVIGTVLPPPVYSTPLAGRMRSSWRTCWSFTTRWLSS